MTDFHNVKYRIYYEDTDAGGIVYYANYLKFFERARTEMLRDNGILQSQLLRDLKIMFVVANCNIEYKKPAALDDMVLIKTKIEKKSISSIIMRQEMYLDDMLLSVVNVRLACIDFVSKKPVKIPDFFPF